MTPHWYPDERREFSLETSSTSAPPEAANAAALPVPAPALPAYWTIRALAGLQTGVVGGLFMLFFYSFGSLMQRQHWWNAANLLGAAVYGHNAIWKGFGRATLAGAAVQILIAGLSGVLCALLFAGRRDSWLFRTSCGLAWGVITYYAVYELLLPRIAPVVPLYSERLGTLMAHLLLGITLTRIQPVYRQLERAIVSGSGSGSGQADNP